MARQHSAVAATSASRTSAANKNGRGGEMERLKEHLSVYSTSPANYLDLNTTHCRRSSHHHIKVLTIWCLEIILTGKASNQKHSLLEGNKYHHFIICSSFFSLNSDVAFWSYNLHHKQLLCDIIMYCLDLSFSKCWPSQLHKQTTSHSFMPVVQQRTVYFYTVAGPA